MGPGGTAVLNGDDPYLRRMGALFAGKTLYFGYSEAVDLRISHSQPEEGGYSFTVMLPQGDTEDFWIPLPGKHNAYNALAAVALGLHFSLNAAEIKEGLAAAVFSAMRMERIQTRSGFCIINDAYNASPTSMQYALQALREGAGSALTVAVLGDMFELGAYAEEGHRRTGQWVADKGIDYLVTVGKQAALIGEGAVETGMSPERVWHCVEHAEALNVLHSLPLSGTHILIKGSRGMSMERIADGLLQAYNRSEERGNVL
jgi:UDP-N-acetylmuramoyl-tripeptide--D-alanyl-D-alanine ligase